MKAIFQWFNNRENGDTAFNFYTVKKKDNKASTQKISNKMLKYDTSMNTMMKNMYL